MEPTKTPALLPEEIEEDELSFDYLMGMDPLELLVANAETEGERRYMITEKGMGYLIVFIPAWRAVRKNSS